MISRDDVQSMWSAVNHVLRRLVGVEDPEYEDLVQSAFTNVLATIDRGRFRGDCPTGGWAAVIARNVAIDAIRARMRERQLFARDAADATTVAETRALDPRTGPEHLTGVKERLHVVHRALLGLKVHKANVIYLHDVLGHELDDVAGILGISVAAAQSRLVRGRREILAQIDLTPGPEVVPRPRDRSAQDLPRPTGAWAPRKQRRRRPPAMLS
ncbi:MAG TPA: sigma-70 family RNA polymerase sigma factor [Polyangia bacterium]|nr:sigma-70 family RNA polymerase sigma factor [Polyangia bacterium]